MLKHSQSVLIITRTILILLSTFIRPKLEDGSWRTPYDPARSIHTVGDFCEGNGWQYTFFAPQDPYGLIALFGGDKPFATKLDGFFTNTDSMGEGASSDITGLIGQYAHGNEPSHHVAYLYAYAGEQWKTAEKVRFIIVSFLHRPTRLASSVMRIVAKCLPGIFFHLWDSIR